MKGAVKKPCLPGPSGRCGRGVADDVGLVATVLLAWIKPLGVAGGILGP